ncbi:Neurogenic locus notch homolog protein 2, partial [Geodia barretti]
MCDNGLEYPYCIPDVCLLHHPCMEGNCTGTGFDSYTCSCNDGFYGVNCSDPVPDMCSLLDPCQEGNCTNTPPEGYRCTCNEGFHGVNCSEAEPVPDVDRELTYLWLIVAGVAGILAPVVILSPLLLILCFTSLTSWRKKNKEYVNNPLYGDASAPASVTGTSRSETGTDHSLTVEAIHAQSNGSPDTLTPPRMSCEDEPNYDIIPGESSNAVGTPVSLEVPPSLAGTFKSDDNSSYYTLSISTNEST